MIVTVTSINYNKRWRSTICHRRHRVRTCVLYYLWSVLRRSCENGGSRRNSFSGKRWIRSRTCIRGRSTIHEPRLYWWRRLRNGRVSISRRFRLFSCEASVDWVASRLFLAELEWTPLIKRGTGARANVDAIYLKISYSASKKKIFSMFLSHWWPVLQDNICYCPAILGWSKITVFVAALSALTHHVGVMDYESEY